MMIVTYVELVKKCFYSKGRTRLKSNGSSAELFCALTLSGREGKQSDTVPGSAKCSLSTRAACFAFKLSDLPQKKNPARPVWQQVAEDRNTLTLIYLPREVSSELMHIISIILEVTIILGPGCFLISYKIGHYTIKPYNYWRMQTFMKHWANVFTLQLLN